MKNAVPALNAWVKAIQGGEEKVIQETLHTHFPVLDAMFDNQLLPLKSAVSFFLIGPQLQQLMLPHLLASHAIPSFSRGEIAHRLTTLTITQKQSDLALERLEHMSFLKIPSAQFHLGGYYEMWSQHALAMEEYQKAANQGHIQAHYNLALCYAREKHGDKTAAFHFEQAATRGHADAQYQLSLCYKAGRGVEKDGKKLHEWLQKAADQKHPRATAVLHAAPPASIQSILPDMAAAKTKERSFAEEEAPAKRVRVKEPSVPAAAKYQQR